MIGNVDKPYRGFGGHPVQQAHTADQACSVTIPTVRAR